MTLHIDALLESSDLFKEAFTHKSLSKDKNFERLEFLGDSLVGALVTELLFKAYPNTPEGDLSRWKSNLVGQSVLSELSDEMGLVKYLMCLESEKSHLAENTRIKASVLESFIGAYYLAKGFNELKAFVKELFKNRITSASELFESSDFKTLFQEKAQDVFSITPIYKTLEKTGPSHKPKFIVATYLKDEIYISAEGASVKQAERETARLALEKMKTHQMEKHGK